MIPLRDIIPSRTVPFVTTALIVLNALVFLYEVTLPAQELEAFVRAYGMRPARLVPASVLSSMFLHAGWAHLIGNMWFLWIFGDNVEDRLGHGRFLLFYLLCGIGAGLGHAATAPTSLVPTVGASGAIAGVMGAYLVLYPRSKVLTLVPLIIVWDIVEIPAVFLLGFWFLLQLVSAGATAGAAAVSGGGIAFVAHAAGFVLGALGVAVFKKRRPPVEWL